MTTEHTPAEHTPAVSSPAAPAAAAAADAAPLRPSRRTFLQTAAAVTAVAGTQVRTAAARTAANDKVRIGLIGCGDLGRRHHLNSVILNKDWMEVVAVCDVDADHVGQAAKDVHNRTGKRPGVYGDFRDLVERDDVDACVVVTPDHWHALCAVAAMDAGKDVYCEKPLTLTIAEGRRMVEAARRNETVFQTGSMQRSGTEFNRAVKLAQKGAIGKIERIDTYIGGVDAGTWTPERTPPENLDWDMWLGPAVYVPYRENQVHYQFRWFEDYSGGKMTDWGAHHNDIAQWILQKDDSGPVKVEGAGEYHPNGPHDVPARFDVVYTYDDGVELHCHSEGRNGVKITGTGGEIFVGRGVFEPSDESLKDAEVEGDDVRRKGGYWDVHYQNWRECLDSRQRPFCDVEIGHRSATVCHLGNIAIKLGRSLQWDPAAEQFVGDDQANRLVGRPKRSPWTL